MKALIESIRLNIKHDFNQQDLIEIPIVYGSEYGPDLESLLKHYKIKLETFIGLHSKAQYLASMMGYSLEFPYLAGLNKKLYINHTSKQKKLIPTGSVIFEGRRCGIVATDTISDWLVTGCVPLSLFSPKESGFARLELGDNIKFRPINENELGVGAFKDINYN